MIATEGNVGLVDIGVFTFSSSEFPPGSSFTACADVTGDSSKAICMKGTNTPAKRPETVVISLP
jgi:hypothetical protein